MLSLPLRQGDRAREHRDIWKKTVREVARTYVAPKGLRDIYYTPARPAGEPNHGVSRRAVYRLPGPWRRSSQNGEHQRAHAARQLPTVCPSRVTRPSVHPCMCAMCDNATLHNRARDRAAETESDTEPERQWQSQEEREQDTDNGEEGMVLFSFCY